MVWICCRLFYYTFFSFFKSNARHLSFTIKIPDNSVELNFRSLHFHHYYKFVHLRMKFLEKKLTFLYVWSAFCYRFAFLWFFLNILIVLSLSHRTRSRYRLYIASVFGIVLHIYCIYHCTSTMCCRCVCYRLLFVFGINRQCI